MRGATGNLRIRLMVGDLLLNLGVAMVSDGSRSAS